MTTISELTTGTQRRAMPTGLVVREAEDGKREVSGIGVPYDQEIEFFGIRETIAPGAVVADENTKLFWRHRDPIGRVIEHHSDEKGWHHKSIISNTATGDEAYALARDGVIDRFSIGFNPIEHEEIRDEDGTVTIRHTKIQVREVSLVPFPAYEGAELTQVRTADQERNDMATSTVTAADLEEVRGAMDDRFDELDREVRLLAARGDEDIAAVETRSAGALLKAAVSGDDTAIAALSRAYDRAFEEPAFPGGTTGDSIAQDAWVGDLTRLVDEAAGIRGLFATGTLPATGMNIEYGELDSNTIDVDEQAAEGDDLEFGKIELTTKTAAVKTYGGYTTLSRQVIERSSVNYLNHALNALAIAAGKRQNTVFRAHYGAAISAQSGNRVDVPTADATYADWLDAVVEAAIKFEGLGLAMDGLIVSKAEFKELIALEGNDGRPVFNVNGDGSNTIGTLNVTALSGSLARLPVYLNTGSTVAGAFFNKRAIRSYQSSLARLQDENIVNLSKDFSVYRYAAIANEIPAAIVPIRRTGA